MDGHVTLRPVLEDDLSWLASLTNDPAGFGPYEWHGWSDPGRLRRSWGESGLLDDDSGVLIVLHGTDRVGVVDWHKVQAGRAASSWAIGIGLAAEFRGRGYGSQAQQLLVRYLFAHTPVNRVEATTEIANVAEQRALERAGFTREGVLRGRSFRQGRYRDQVIYGVLRDDVKLEDPGSEDATVLAPAQEAATTRAASCWNVRAELVLSPLRYVQPTGPLGSLEVDVMVGVGPHLT